MRANPLVRAISAATVLTLAASSVVSAQTEVDTRFATERGETLLSATVTSALDDSATNALIERTARKYHADPLGGKTSQPEVAKKGSKKEPARGGWLSFPDLADTDAVTQKVLDVAGEPTPDLIVVSGGDWKANVGIARLNPSSFIVDMGQPAPCLNETGQPDLGGECLDGQAPGNYLPVNFAVEEGAYLAGVIAARESRGKPLAVISGSEDCLECDRYATGFINGARSVEPEIEIQTAYLANDEASGFGDEASAKTFTQAFLDVHQPGVLMPIGRGATMGMIEAACEAEVRVIGAGIDVSSVRPDLANPCVMASVTKDSGRAVEEAMFYFSQGNNPPVITYDLTGGGVAVTDEWRLSSTKRVDTNDFYAEADLAVRTGQVEPCLDGCGVFVSQPEAAEEATAD